MEIAAQCVRLDAHRAKPPGKQPVQILPAGGGKCLKFLPDIPQRPPVKGNPSEPMAVRGAVQPFWRA